MTGALNQRLRPLGHATLDSTKTKINYLFLHEVFFYKIIFLDHLSPSVMYVDWIRSLSALRENESLVSSLSLVSLTHAVQRSRWILEMFLTK